MTEALRIYGDVAARLRSHFAGIKVAFAKTGKAAEQAVLGLNVFGAIMDEANFVGPAVPLVPFRQRPFSRKARKWARLNGRLLDDWMAGRVDDSLFRDRVYAEILGVDRSERDMDARRQVYRRLGEITQLDAITRLGLLVF